MKRFHFSLAAVKEFRKTKLELAEAALAEANSERAAKERESSRLATERSRAHNSVLRQTSVNAAELAALESYQKFLRRESQRAAEEIFQASQRVHGRQQGVIEAQRQLRLLENLEVRQRAEWQKSVDRELEQMAGELHLAAMARRSKRNKTVPESDT